MITEITDHSDRALLRLPSQFDNATNLRALVSVVGDRAQTVETVLIDLLNSRAISTASGEQLDRIGEILNLSRVLGEADSAYRARLYAETSELEKSGELESLLDVFGFLMQPVSGIEAFEVYPAALQLTALDDADPQDTGVDQVNRAAMNRVKAGGIDLIMQVATTDAFYFADETETDVNGNGPTDIAHGFGDEVLTDGGKLSRYF